MKKKFTMKKCLREQKKLGKGRFESRCICRKKLGFKATEKKIQLNFINKNPHNQLTETRKGS